MIVVLYPPLQVGCPQEFALEAAVEDLGLPQGGSGVEVGWVTGTLAAPDTQRSQWLGPQETWRSRRTLQSTPAFLPGESHREAWQATVHSVTKSWT